MTAEQTVGHAFPGTCGLGETSGACADGGRLGARRRTRIRSSRYARWERSLLSRILVTVRALEWIV